MNNRKIIEELKDTTRVLKTDDIKTVLDSALAYNLSQKEKGKDDFVNILFIGEMGSGKTAVIDKWLEDNKLNYYVILPDSAKMLVNAEYEALDRPNSVLFLEHFDLAPKEIRANFTGFIKTHTKPTDEEIWTKSLELKKKGNLKFVGNEGESLEDVINNSPVFTNPQAEKCKLNNFLFTIATTWPDSPIYNGYKFDEEELSCFKRVEVVMTPKKMLEYITGEFGRILAEENDSEEIAEFKGRLNLAQAILRNKNFEFSNDSSKRKKGDRVICYQNFVMTLLDSDGTKEGFLKAVPSCMGKNALPMIEEILKDYVDQK